MFAPNLLEKTGGVHFQTQIARTFFSSDLAVATLVFHGSLNGQESCHVDPRKIPPFRYTSYKSRPLIAKNQTEWFLVFSFFKKICSKRDAGSCWMKA